MAFPLNTPNNAGIDLNTSTFNPFTLLGFQTTMWDGSNSVLTPIPIMNGYMVFPFPINTIFTTGLDITDANAKKQVSYPAFAFETMWAIQEDVTYPFLLQTDGEYIDDPVLTTRKVYVFIAEDVEGSLFHDGKVYKSLRKTTSFDSISGVQGSVITHQYGGDKLKDSDNLPYVFIFSGVQDPTRPGGYGSIQEMTERSVMLLSDRSNNVAFYYLPSLLPAYDYLMQISTMDGVFHIALFLDNPSFIRCVMHTGEIVDVGLVEVSATDASTIRVMTNTGLMALQKVEV